MAGSFVQNEGRVPRKMLEFKQKVNENVDERVC